MLFESAKAAFVAAENELAFKDAMDSWESDEEIEAAVLRIMEAETAIARAPAPHSAGVAYKLELALRAIDESQATGMLMGRLRAMLGGALADLNRGGCAALV